MWLILIHWLLRTSTTFVSIFFFYSNIIIFLFYLKRQSGSQHWTRRVDFWIRILHSLWHSNPKSSYLKSILSRSVHVFIKFWISSSFYKFSFRIFIILDFEVFWPQRPQRPQNGLEDFFSKITFLKSVHSKEKDEACLGFLLHKLVSLKQFFSSFEPGPFEVETQKMIQICGFNSSKSLELTIFIILCGQPQTKWLQGWMYVI